MDEVKFEWDEAKAKLNTAKHGIAFEAAQKIFEDIFAFEDTDLSSVFREIRFSITGMVEGRLLTAIYTERGDKIRLISARKATNNERQQYYSSQAAE
jgi:hypothetical protein